MEKKGESIYVNKDIFNNLIENITSLTNRIWGLSSCIDEEIQSIKNDIFKLGADILYIRDIRDKTYREYINAKKRNIDEKEIDKLLRRYILIKDTYNELKKNREL